MDNTTQPITISDQGSTARIAAHLGFNCYSFKASIAQQTVDVLDAGDDFAEGNTRPSAEGIPILFPFPNRIRGGKYEWDGESYELPESLCGYDRTGNAIHGFCLDRPWRVTNQTTNSVTGEFQLSIDASERRELWPADFRIALTYSLQANVLRCEIEIENTDEDVLPWGFGTHPYFRLPLSNESSPKQCLIQAPTSEEWELIECLPTGKRIPISEEYDLRPGAYFDLLKLDHVLTGLPDQNEPLEMAILDEAAGLQIVQRCPSLFREIVAFTPPGRDAVCLEPYTCLTDAINLETEGVDAGWQTLEPGEQVQTWIEISAEQIIV